MNLPPVRLAAAAPKGVLKPLLPGEVSFTDHENDDFNDALVEEDVAEEKGGVVMNSGLLRRRLLVARECLIFNFDNSFF